MMALKGPRGIQKYANPPEYLDIENEIQEVWKYCTIFGLQWVARITEAELQV